MRTLLPMLLFLTIGCNHCPRLFDCSSCGKDGECANEAPKRASKADCVADTSCSKPAAPKCEQPEIEIKAPKPIHIKLPPQQYIVQPQAMPVQPQAMMQPQSFAPQSFSPQSFSPQSFSPQPGAPQQVMMMPVMQPQSARPAGGARPGLTIDFFRLPIPYPCFIAVPDAPPQMQAVAMAPQSFAPQSFAPQSFAPPQQHVMVPVPGTVDVPVQTMVKVPYQAQIPVPVQPQSFVPQSVGVQPQSFVPQSVAVQPQRMIPVVPQATTFQPQSAPPPQMQGITLQQAEDFCRLVEQMKQQMNDRK